MDDTSGFYKYDEGTLLFGPNFVESRDFKLERSNHEEYTYPVQGWSWFYSEEDAREYFGIKKTE